MFASGFSGAAIQRSEYGDLPDLGKLYHQGLRVETTRQLAEALHEPGKNAEEIRNLRGLLEEFDFEQENSRVWGARTAERFAENVQAGKTTQVYEDYLARGLEARVQEENARDLATRASKLAALIRAD